MRGVVTTFKMCTFYGFIVEEATTVLPFISPLSHKLEFIGGADTCALGNEGTKAKKLFKGVKGRMENVYNGYAAITSRMLHGEAHILAGTGKGVHSNYLDWGTNMTQIWTNTLASRDSKWKMDSWIPDVVVINLGTNDLCPPASSETEIVEAYTSLLKEVRYYRPDAHVFCVVYDQKCMSCEDPDMSPEQLSIQLQEIVKVAISKVNRNDHRLHYTYIKVPGGLHPSDYSSDMHFSVKGHEKVARVLADEISRYTHWSIEESPDIMPYPQEKKSILVPVEDKNCQLM